MDKNGFNRRNITWIMGGVVVLAFISGIMVDIDHPIAWIFGIHNGRFLHPYFALVGYWSICVGFILAVACVCRLALLRFLKM
jgi:hypothetical protein